MALMGPSFTRGVLGACWALACGIVQLAAAEPATTGVAATMPEEYFPQLRTILQSALKQAPRAIESELEIAVSQAWVHFADAQRYPRLGGQIDFANNQTAISGNTSTKNRDNGLFYRLELNQSLYHWGALKNDSARARIRVAISERQFAEVYRQVLLTLRQSYLQLVAKRAEAEHARSQLRLREKELEIARERQARGLVSTGDVFGIELNAREQAIAALRVETELTGMIRTFCRVAGVPVFDEKELPTDIPAPKPPTEVGEALLAEFLRGGGRSAFEARVAELQVRDADLSYRIARVRQLPKFGASAGYYLENTTNATSASVIQQGVERQSVAVRADWSIFDGFASRGAKLEARAQKRLAERRLATATERWMEEAQSLHRMLKLDAEIMAMAETRRDLAEHAVREMEDEVKLGNAPAGEIENRRSDLLHAKARAAAARATFLGRWSEFVSLTGADPVLNTQVSSHVREKR